MTTREALKVSDLDVIASTLSHDARWLLRIRKELWELAEESSHEQEAYEVRKRLKEILIPPDDELEEAEAQAVRDAMPDPFQIAHPSSCNCIVCCESRDARLAQETMLGH